MAARVDAEIEDFASAMALPLLKDGRNAATGNLPMGGFRHTNVGAPVSATNYMRAKDFIENVPIYMVDAEASADRISVSAAFFTTASAQTAPRDGSHVLIKAGSDKSSAVAIRLNTGDGSPHSAAVILANGSALYSGAIRSGGIYEFFWSSSDTAWQLANPQVDYAASAYPGVILLATQAEVDAGTDVPHAITPSQLAGKFSASYANATSAGLVELATTAEAISGTNVSAVLTPAAIRIMTPYAMVLRVNVSGSAVFLSRSTHASAWTASVSTGIVKVTHNIGLASANEMAINIQIAKHDETRTYAATLASTDASSFKFTAFETGSASGNITSANYHIVTHRIV